MVHAFLIRNPKEAVPSWYKLALSPETGFDYFDPEELGIHELRTLYDFVASNSSVQPLLIDSQDMIKNSHKVLALLCSRAGISFKDEMLDWESSASQAKELFSKYPGRYSIHRHQYVVQKLIICGLLSSGWREYCLAKDWSYHY